MIKKICRKDLENYGYEQGYLKGQQDMKQKVREAIEKHTRCGAPYIDKREFIKELNL